MHAVNEHNVSVHSAKGWNIYNADGDSVGLYQDPDKASVSCPLGADCPNPATFLHLGPSSSPILSWSGSATSSAMPPAMRSPTSIWGTSRIGGSSDEA